MSYPLSILDGKAADALTEALVMHVPEGASIIDPCAGESYWWDPRTLNRYNVTRSDIKPPHNQDLFTLADDRPEYREAFDCVVYDPPYLIGADGKNDPRASDYGDYSGDMATLRRYMIALHQQGAVSRLLKVGGTLIVKCQDQYVPSLREFKMWHLDWLEALQFGLYYFKDFFVCRYHHVSPTAYQVKNRPCSIIAHSYLIVAEKIVSSDAP